MFYQADKTHIFTFENKHIMLDINSAAVHDISPEAYQAVCLWRDTNCDLRDLRASPEIREALESLVDEGLLMSGDDELSDYQFPQDQVIKAICLHAAHDCNLRCEYCFAGEGAFGGDRSLMSFETGKKALDFLFEASGNRVHVELDYFGGEPLMNFDVVKRHILYGEEESAQKGKILKQTLTTNGVLLSDEVIAFLNAHDVSLVLSLDGRPATHDEVRPLINGQGSYNIAAERIKAAARSRNGENYYIRGTYTRYNKDFFADARHLVEEGFLMVSVEPVVAAADEKYALREEDLPELYEQYERLARYFARKWQEGEPFSFFHFNLDLDGGPCLPKRLSGCGAGYEYIAISPDGSIYPCHQFVGNDKFRAGDVFTGILKPEIGVIFRDSNVLNKSKCSGCWARFYCGGGCHANAYNHNRDLRMPYAIGCELEKKRLELAIWIKVIQAQE
jgi:uncharacterized protein